MTNRFEYTDPDGDRLRVEPFPGKPAILLILGTQGEDDVASLRIPTAHLEEVIAGLRDMARQAAGRPAPCPCSCGYPGDEDTVHPANGAPCYTVFNLGTQAAISTPQASEQQPPADVAPLSDFIDLFGLTDVVASSHEARTTAEGAGA